MELYLNFAMCFRAFAVIVIVLHTKGWLWLSCLFLGVIYDLCIGFAWTDSC